MEAKEWKDTVMTKEQIRQTLISMGSAEGDLTFAQRKLLERQAGIAFTAGEKKVVEWIYENSETYEAYSGRIIKFNLGKSDWQEFLKSEGIEGCNLRVID